MIKVCHHKGNIYISDDHAKIIISNLNEFSYYVEKIKNSPIENDDEIEYKSRLGIIDMLNSVRQDFIRYRELRCLRK